MSHNSIYYLFSSDREESTNAKLWAIFYIGMIIIVMVWPIFMAIFLIKNRHNLEEKDFRHRFSSMYLDNKTEK